MFLPCCDSCEPLEMDMEAHVSFEPHFSLDICPGVGLLNHTAALFLLFKETLTALHSGLPMYISMNRAGRFRFLHTLERVKV